MQIINKNAEIVKLEKKLMEIKSSAKETEELNKHLTEK